MHQILLAVWIFGTERCMFVDSKAKVSPISGNCPIRFESFKNMVLQRRRLWRVFGTDLKKERRVECTKGCSNSCFAKVSSKEPTFVERVKIMSGAAFQMLLA